MISFPAIFHSKKKGGWTLNIDTPYHSVKGCTDNTLYYGNGYWFAGIYKNGTNYYVGMYASDPTGTWTNKDVNTYGGILAALYYGNSKWVCSGWGGGYICSANDASSTWTDHGKPGGTYADKEAIYYANSYWVSSSNTSYLYTATDPTSTWTQRSYVSGLGIYTFGHDGTYWVAAGPSGKLATATDPTGTWTERTPNMSTNAIYKVLYANSIWVAVGAGGALSTATDPTGTWTSRTSGFSTSAIYSATYESVTGTWYTCGAGGKIFTATDPTGTWTQETSPYAGGISSLHYSSSYATAMVVATTDNGDILYKLI